MRITPTRLFCLLIWLLLLRSVVDAQCRFFDGKELSVSESAVSLTVDIDNTGGVIDLVRIARYTGGVRDSESTQYQGFDPTDNVTGMSIWNSDFAAGVTGQEVFPEYSEDDGATWIGVATCGSAICPSGAGGQPGGYTCDANNMIVVDTTAAPSPGPVVAPTAPTHTYVGVAPAITGNTYTASACSQIQDKYDEAVTQANIDDLIHEVAWTATGVCHPGQFATPAKYLDLCGVTTATGGVVFTGFGPSRHGARPEADWWGVGPTLTWDPSDWAPQNSLLRSSCESRRIWFSEDYIWSFGTPSRDAIVAAQPADIPIAGVTYGPTEIELASPIDLPVANNYLLRMNVPGMSHDLATWGGLMNVFPDVDHLRFGGTANEGTWTGSGGGLTRKRIHPFTADTSGLLTMPHLLGDGTPFPILNITSNVISTDGTHRITLQRRPIYIDGCGAGADGVNFLTGGNQTAGMINLGRSVTDCTGGTVRALHLVQLSNLQGVTTNALSCVFTVPGATTIQLLECTDGVTSGPVDWSAGSGITGDASFDVVPYPEIVQFTNLKEVSFPGFVLRGSQDSAPWASVSGGFTSNGVYTEDVAIVDSFLNAVHRVRAIDPTGGNAAFHDHNAFWVPAAVNFRQGERLYVRGLDVVGSGFYFFAETGTNQKAPRDLTMCGGRMIYDERFVGGTASRGYLSSFRQGVELKEGVRRFWFCGLTFWEVPVVNVKTNAALTFQYSANVTFDTEAGGYLNGVEDGRVENIYGSGRLMLTYGVQILGGSRYNRFVPTDRAVIRNNLWFGREGMHSYTCGDVLEGSPSFCASDFSAIYAGTLWIDQTNNLEFANNTLGLQDSASNEGYWWYLNKNTTQAAAHVHDNAIIVSRVGAGAIRCSNTYETWTGLCEDAWTIEGAASSRFTMENTQLIPCTLDPSDTDWAATNAAHADNATAYVNWKAGSLPTRITGSADGQSCWERVALGFASDWSRKAALAGAGHDHTELLDALGFPALPDDALEFKSLTHEARIVGYRAPNAGACSLCARPATDDRGDSSGVCAADSGAQDNRTVAIDLTDLTGQAVKIELLCSQAIIHHWQGTAP